MATSTWRAHLWKDWKGVDFVGPSGKRFPARLVEGRPDGTLHRFLRGEPLRGVRVNRGGWEIRVPEGPMHGKPTRAEDTFRVVEIVRPGGQVVSYEAYYDWFPREMLSWLRSLTEEEDDAERILKAG